MLLAPIVRERKGEYRKELKQLQAPGICPHPHRRRNARAGDPITLDKNKKHTLEVVVDRLVVKEGITTRLADSLETALKLAEGLVRVVSCRSRRQRLMLFSAHDMPASSADCRFPEITPRMFSFNNPHGACPECAGLGTRNSSTRIWWSPIPSCPCAKGPSCPGKRAPASTFSSFLKRSPSTSIFRDAHPFCPAARDCARCCSTAPVRRNVRFFFDQGGRRHFYEKPFEGVIPHLQRRYQESDSDGAREPRTLHEPSCPARPAAAHACAPRLWQ
jgi:excinuclease ABC subunit A